MEIYDENLSQWNAYNAGSAPYTTSDMYTSHPWITNVATDGTCTIDVDIALTNTFWTVTLDETKKKYKVRITISDV